VRKFREEQRSNDIDDVLGFDVSENHERPYEREKARGKRKRGFPKGPRKAAEPTGDIRARMGKASEAFIQENYEEARAIVYDVIRINAETFEAWTLLASIWKEFGDVHNALHALMVASHLRPKDPAQWMNAANFALNETGDERSKYLSCATFCLSAAIRANPKEDFEARYKKAEVFREMGATTSAIKEYKQILKHRPHDTNVLKVTAESFLDLNDAQSAQKLYKESIEFYMRIEDAHEQQFGWADLRVYTEIHAFAGEYREGIMELKRVARWLLGRKSETYWDEVIEDDREWDLEDQRRIQIPDFDATQSSPEQYGHGLPIDIRTKLGLFRIRLGYFDEGLVGYF
jgi:general transcription factor 3C polypeptide 3 (transcription factor C subunit 4)